MVVYNTDTMGGSTHVLYSLALFRMESTSRVVDDIRYLLGWEWYMIWILWTVQLMFGVF